MKKKVVAGAFVFLFFIAIVTVVIIKDTENRKEADKITGNTIRNALESDSGMSVDEIAAEFSDYAMESAGYKNLADIAYAKTEGDTIWLVFTDRNIESAFYLATRLIDESEEKTMIIIWDGAEYEVSKEKVRNSEELADIFPDEWGDVVNKALTGYGIQIGAGTAENLETVIGTFIEKSD